ncbi:hypothetical protein [Shimia sp. MIT1388]|uniref:hypothetical protein n=1 Tax=Shimia sp. MIT1388 TaxID=3096992 RepID=UPI00399A58F8
MQGWKLFKHALRMVIGNWREVLRIFFVPMILGIVVFFAFLFGVTFLLGEGVLPVFAFAAILAYVTVASWCIVSWHRFVLLEERPTKWLPPFDFSAVVFYFLRGFGLGLIFFVLAMPLLLVVVPSLEAFGAFASIIVAIAVLVGVSVFCMRLSLVLPAVAVDEPMTMRESFAATKQATLPFAGLVVTYGALQAGLNMMSEYFADTENLLGMLATFVGLILFGLINISLLTTFYGHYVEGRAID